jgi:hypothetical protein
MMKARYKILLGGAALALASAASFPGAMNVFYPNTYPSDWAKRQALATCERTSSTFMRFLASERQDCYARMRDAAAAADVSGIWSKHDRSAAALSEAAGKRSL